MSKVKTNKLFSCLCEPIFNNEWLKQMQCNLLSFTSSFDFRIEISFVFQGLAAITDHASKI